MLNMKRKMMMCNEMKIDVEYVQQNDDVRHVYDDSIDDNSWYAQRCLYVWEIL